MDRECANPDCHRTLIIALGRCQACYKFYKRHKRDIRRREMRLRYRVRKRPVLCRVCHYKPVRARGRCHACHKYWLRNGRDRECL